MKTNIITSNLLNKFMKSIKINTRRMSSAADDVIIENIKDKGVITLNRPKALNALNLSMVKKIYPVLKQWENDKMAMVIIKGAGDKAFCSGGDVKSVAVNGLKGDVSLGQEFFKQEYTMNALIGSYSVPYVALIDGITMGGGVGLSVHGRYRVATEKTLFAMPEMQIGLFPDVGTTYFLPRLQGKLGLFLALTGYRLKGVDNLMAGVATHFCTSDKMPELEKALLNCANDEDIKQTLRKFELQDHKDFSLKPHMSQIDKCFNGESVEEIFKNLEMDGSKWAQEILDLMNTFSPTSLKLALKALTLGRQLPLNDCLNMEFRLASACLRGHDFFEGVRALLIDKDKKPIWKPNKLSEVTDEFIESHFKKLSDDQELLKHKL